MDEGELTMICLDTFDWLHDPITSCWFLDQIDAAQIYCERKLKAHPDNLVGIVIFGAIVSDVVVRPTNDLESIRERLACIGTESQSPNLLKGINLCRSGWYPYKEMKKRVLVFSAGPLLPNRHKVSVFVDFLKESRAVVDVVHFGYRPKGLLKGNHYKPEENLKALVNAMNDNNKENEDSRFFFIEDDGFSLSHHISSSSILPPLVAEEEVPIIHSQSKAKIHSFVGEEVVDSGWPYGEEVVDSRWPYGEKVFDFDIVGEEVGAEVFDFDFVQQEVVGWD